jgi:hypothetical protein
MKVQSTGRYAVGFDWKCGTYRCLFTIFRLSRDVVLIGWIRNALCWNMLVFISG